MKVYTERNNDFIARDTVAILDEIRANNERREHLEAVAAKWLPLFKIGSNLSIIIASFASIVMLVLVTFLVIKRADNLMISIWIAGSFMTAGLTAFAAIVIAEEILNKKMVRLGLFCKKS